MDLAVWSEGNHIDDGGNLISTYYVDLRTPGSRVPITTLIKSGRSEHAIENSRTIQIATPAYHRERGKGPMWDPSEGKATRVIRESSTIDDPADLAEAQELNRATELVGSSLKFSTTSVKRSTRSTKHITHGKKLLDILCFDRTG